VELVLEIAAMLNSHFKLGIPNDNVEIIENLRHHSILSDKISDKIQQIRAFRNVLVHIYDKLDDRLAFNNIRASLDSFPEYEAEIMQYVESKDKTG